MDPAQALEQPLGAVDPGPRHLGGGRVAMDHEHAGGGVALARPPVRGPAEGPFQERPAHPGPVPVADGWAEVVCCGQIERVGQGALGLHARVYAQHVPHPQVAGGGPQRVQEGHALPQRQGLDECLGGGLGMIGPTGMGLGQRLGAAVHQPGPGHAVFGSAARAQVCQRAEHHQLVVAGQVDHPVEPVGALGLGRQGKGTQGVWAPVGQIACEDEHALHPRGGHAGKAFKQLAQLVGLAVDIAHREEGGAGGEGEGVQPRPGVGLEGGKAVHRGLLDGPAPRGQAVASSAIAWGARVTLVGMSAKASMSPTHTGPASR